MSKETIVDTLNGIAQLLDLKGENPFKIRAYVAGARAVEMFSGDLEAAVRNGELGQIEGIGDALAKKITELVTTGRLQYFEDLKAGFPPTIFELFEISGLGAKKIKALYEQLGVGSIAQLDAACREERVAKLPGFGEKTARNLLAAVAQRMRSAHFFRLGDVAGPTLSLANELRSHPAVLRASEAGSFRRRKEVVRDLDFVASTKNPAEVAEFFVTRPEVTEVIARGPTKVSVRLQSGVQCDLRLVTDTEYPYALHHFTGSKEHNIELRQRALERGWSINEYRFSAAPKADGTGEPLPTIRDEPEFYRALGLDYIPPELREGLGEIEAAEHGALPELVTLENLRGTFHCHTHASDGHNSLEEMAAAAQELGLEYLGIADHSKSSIQANGQDEQRLAAQAEQIRELNAGYAREGSQFRLFAGIECDILKDGALDFSDEVLAALDYVVVSVHNSFNQPPAEMTRRIIRAIENPYVTILGHLTGRMLLIREGYTVDVPAILDAAAATGTIIELNGNPRRLDMDWRWWRRAKEKGVRCAIDPDAHSTQNLQHLWFGVTQARKGWLTRGDVVNCAPLGEIEPILQAKRARWQTKTS
jgi:DNA polymerase (family 10)